MGCMSCGKTRIAGYGKTTGNKTSGIKKSSTYSSTSQNQYGTPKVKVSFAKRGS